MLMKIRFLIDTAVINLVLGGLLLAAIYGFDWSVITTLTEFAWVLVIAEVALACLLLTSQTAGSSVGHSRENLAARSMIDDPSQVTRSELFNASRAISAGRLLLATLWPLSFIGVVALVGRF